MNNRGDIVFTANGLNTAAGDDGLWAYRSGTYQSIASAGQHAPGMPSDILLITLGQFAMNAAGNVAFEGSTGRLVTVTPPTGDPYLSLEPVNRGLWRERDGVLELVAGGGQPAPGAAPGETFGDFTDVGFNAAGMVAFAASLIAPGQPLDFNYDSIWIDDASGNLKLIARVGDQLSSEYNGNQFAKTIASLRFTGNSGNQDGLRSGFNESGQLAFYAAFTDGTSGIFLTAPMAVPEPGVLVLIATALELTAPFLTRSRRRGRGRTNARPARSLSKA
jgi:hypothetical protein